MGASSSKFSWACKRIDRVWTNSSLAFFRMQDGVPDHDARGEVSCKAMCLSPDNNWITVAMSRMEGMQERGYLHLQNLQFEVLPWRTRQTPPYDLKQTVTRERDGHSNQKHPKISVSSAL
eukprot:1918079-Amphidinium_carterae.1